MDIETVAGRVRLSATDLAHHVTCRHLTVLDLAVAQERMKPPELTAWLPASLQQGGEAREQAYIAHLRSQHRSIVDLRDCRFDADGFRATREARRSGAGVLLQASLGGERWVGRANVLRRSSARASSAQGPYA